MDPEFWRARWAEKQTAFHEGKTNHFLGKHVGRLTGRVLVPLCGKTEDLAFLASMGHEVVGIELVETAVAEFFAEHNILPTITRTPDFAVYVCAGITIIAGDFFATTRQLVGRVDSIYDRAAMVALPPEMRRRYVHHLRQLTPHATTLLLVTLDYPNDPLTRPPFSVSEENVRAEYGNAPVEMIDQGVEPTQRFVDGMERCYVVELTAQRPTS
ncbi:MAG TPA: thiopurine S-methyltransferase [Kofleriaceae bacterium]|jgi:thiopurine S-methyltransferase|nr:thiopurine S-methyltransferase [Kofleriaceae bacterium]